MNKITSQNTKKIDSEKNSERYLKLDLANKLIYKISSIGRHLFHYKGNVASLKIMNNKVYYCSEVFEDRYICLSTKYDSIPKKWHHGRTLFYFCVELKKFIMGKESSATLVGIEHWGYNEEEIKKIVSYAEKLGIKNNSSVAQG